jgi:hypothetical protein
MLMAISLAEKLGASHHLSTFSVHPRLVSTNLGTHLELYGESDADMVSMRKSPRILYAFDACELKRPPRLYL